DTAHRLKEYCEAPRKDPPAAHYVWKGPQPFRAHMLDLFEPQDHPNDFAYPGAPPTPPYDIAGWTLAYQMAVQFDRVLDGFGGPFEEVKGPLPPPRGRVADAEGAAGFFLDTRLHDAFRGVNRLLAAGGAVRRLREPFAVQGTTYPAGTFFVPRTPPTLPLLERLAFELGTPFIGSPTAPGKEAVELKPVRLALWDRYGGFVPSGWGRSVVGGRRVPFPGGVSPRRRKGGRGGKDMV